MTRIATTFFVAWAVAALWFGSNAGLTVIGLLTFAYGAVLSLVLSSIVLFVQRSRRGLIGLAGTFAIVVLVLLEVPFIVRFELSRPWLDRYAEQSIARGRPHDEPVRVGLFIARETEVLPDGVVRIITTECIIDDCGVAFSRNGWEPPVIGEDGYWRLSRRWWRWHRSW